MKYGFEREWFVVDQQGTFIEAPQYLPMDSCGYLLEARGEPHSDPVTAAFLLRAAEHKLARQVTSLGLSLRASDLEKLPRAFVHRMLRTHGKNISQRRNLYGKNPRMDNYSRAGLHVHFSNERTIATNPGATTINQFIDLIPIIRHLDETFDRQIHEAKRTPGEYELKPYGFEYRSLPASASFIEVAHAIEELHL